MIVGAAFAVVGGLLRYCVAPAQALTTKIGPIRSIAQYDGALAIASKRAAVGVVDVAAVWCDFCTTLDTKILPHPRVVELLQGMAVLKVDVTPMDDASRTLLREIGAFGPPMVFLVDLTTGREITETRTVGPFDLQSFIARLQPHAAASPLPERATTRHQSNVR